MKKIKTEGLGDNILLEEDIIEQSEKELEKNLEQPVNILNSEDDVISNITEADISDAVALEKEKEQQEKDYQQIPIEIMSPVVHDVEAPVVEVYKQHWETLKQQVTQDLHFYRGQRNVNDSRYGTAICERVLTAMQAIERKK